MSGIVQAKFQVIAEELGTQIAEGKWTPGEKLPSVRALAEKYNVASATATRALEVLRGRGLIQPNERSGVYEVVEQGLLNGTHDFWAVCLRVTPGPWQQGTWSLVSAGFADLLRSPGIRLTFDAIPTDLDAPDAVLRQRVRAAMRQGVTGLFLLPSRIGEDMADEDERLLAVCRECEMPVVLIERNLRGDCRPLECDLVCPDDLDGGLRCALHLMERGRKRLAFVRGGPTSSHNDMLAGFLAAHYHARLRGLIPADQPFPLVLEYPESTASKDAYRTLCDRILAAGIDGVVCYHDRAVIGLAIALLARGKRVPEDVALTGFDDQPIGQEFTLGVTTYPFPAREVAFRAAQMLRERIKAPAAAPVKVVVASRLIVRESSGGTESGLGE